VQLDLQLISASNADPAEASSPWDRVNRGIVPKQKPVRISPSGAPEEPIQNGYSHRNDFESQKRLPLPPKGSLLRIDTGLREVQPRLHTPNRLIGFA